ncbi:E3 ubiquitin-protein ligase MARCH2-like protein [Sarcoptes scabiei]|uniref:E3 ubiquitin-protein ligase MARCH2-like protein n=1 Tax=Sarcoptes scabiei TaxID=52283 RepID=A0A132A390_SARSC|nr:E3 ubiquitin-protein ligase MARCH2-like protein [Sarcoptes scabiei]
MKPRLIYCRLCLEPENSERQEMTFLPNLCYCQESNYHRKCLTEWIENSGFTSCHRCQCDYDVIYQSRSLLDFLWTTKEDLIRTLQKILRFINILHITLIVLFIILMILVLIRSYFNLKSLYYYCVSTSKHFTEWKRSHFNVLLKSDL